MAFYSSFMVKCKQIKIVEKTVRFGVCNSQTIQNTEADTKSCTTEKAVRQKISSEL